MSQKTFFNETHQMKHALEEYRLILKQCRSDLLLKLRKVVREEATGVVETDTGLHLEQSVEEHIKLLTSYVEVINQEIECIGRTEMNLGAGYGKECSCGADLQPRLLLGFPGALCPACLVKALAD